MKCCSRQVSSSTTTKDCCRLFVMISSPYLWLSSTSTTTILFSMSKVWCRACNGSQNRLRISKNDNHDFVTNWSNRESVQSRFYGILGLYTVNREPSGPLVSNWSYAYHFSACLLARVGSCALGGWLVGWWVVCGEGWPDIC